MQFYHAYDIHQLYFMPAALHTSMTKWQKYTTVMYCDTKTQSLHQTLNLNLSFTAPHIHLTLLQPLLSSVQPHVVLPPPPSHCSPPHNHRYLLHYR